MATTKLTLVLCKTQFGTEIPTATTAVPVGWLTISTPVEVEFELLSDETILQAEIAALDEAIEEVRARALRDLQALADKKASLLALPSSEIKLEI